MTKRLLAILLLWASPALAQIGVPSTAPGSSAPSSTITNGVTDTSGCVAGGVLRSISNLVDCGAGFTYASGVAGVGTASTTTGAIRIFNSGHAFYTEMTVSGTQGANVSYTFPDDDGTNGQVLSTNGSGVLDWIDAAAGSVTTAALKDATYCESATGNDSYACTLTTAPADLAAMKGVVVSFLADVGNTGAATVAFNGFAATNIVKIGATTTTALVTSDIRAGAVVTVVYDGTSFECLSCDGNRASLPSSQTWTGSNTFSGNVTFSVGMLNVISAVTTTATTNTSTSNYLYTNTGDTDGATITLMDNPAAGTAWNFAINAAQTLTIVASTGETLMHGASTCGTSLTSNTVGSTIRIVTVVSGSGGVLMTFGATGTWTCNA